MILHGKRIRNFAKHFGYLTDGQNIVFGVQDLERFTTRLTKAGFSPNIGAGDTILPNVKCGPISRYNAEGKNVVRRDLPKETAYRQVEWTWIERHGQDKVEKSDAKDVPYERYPREFMPPPSVEISLMLGADGQPLMVAPVQTVDSVDNLMLLHTVNLFLEIFGECQTFTEEGVALIHVPLKRLSWNILPPGVRPWAQLHQEVDPLMKHLSPNKQKLVGRRFETINSYKPDFVATGQAGFAGYVVFGFEREHVYLCESMYTGNATYVFAENWAQLSQKTKAEILNEDLQKERIIHREGWPIQIERLLLHRE